VHGKSRLACRLLKLALPRKRICDELVRSRLAG
jgi:hypothetical protein